MAKRCYTVQYSVAKVYNNLAKLYNNLAKMYNNLATPKCDQTLQNKRGQIVLYCSYETAHHCHTRL